MFWVCKTLSSMAVYFLGLLMRKYDKVSARLRFSPKYLREVAENSIKPLEAMSIFLGSKIVLNLVYFWGLRCPKFSIFLGFSKIFCV